MIEPCDIDGVAALMAAERTAMRKLKGEKDTEFVKRIVCAYLNADAELTLQARAEIKQDRKRLKNFRI